MSSWRSKSSNKKFDNKQILNTVTSDYSTSLPVPNQRNTRNSMNKTIIGENRNTANQNNETRQLLNNQKQTSTIKDANSSISR
jgi:hypothetical protein